MTTNDIANDTANTEVSGSPADQLKRILVALLGFFVILHSAVLLVYYVGYAFWGNQPWIIDAMGYMLTWLFIPTLVLLPLAILSRSKVLIAVAAVPVVLFLLTYGRSFLPRGAAAEASPTFTVMTYNVLDLNQEYDAVAQQIIDQNPDILGLHELEAHMLEALEERLGDRYPYRKTEPGRGLYSRYPFDDYATFQLAGDGHWGQQALFTIDGR